MTKDKLVEAVARAIANEFRLDGGDEWAMYFPEARAAIAALEAQGWQKVPEGKVVAPSRPSNEMLDAGQTRRDEFEHNGGYCSVFAIYNAMITAATPQQSEV